ncbi:MAG: hypothetical protein IJU60_00345 [Acholeplasmatales bacterium]|nr:hypothetical protein [Acholeplasmatales bacterium]
MVACFIIVGIALALLVYYIIIKCQKYDLKELFFKTIISTLFVVLALVATYNSGKFTIFNLFVIIGLVLGLIGDILLDLKNIDLERTVGYTYGGFVAFGLGHIMYMTGLIMTYFKGNALFIICPIILDIIISIITLVMEKPLKLNYGSMKPTVFCYALCLFGTFSFALSLAIQNGFAVTSLNMFLVGATLFAISDLVLSGTYFGKDKERPIDFIMNYIPYYGAQYVIAFLLLFL